MGVSLMRRIEDRWVRRQDPTEQVTVNSSVQIPAEPERVWPFVVAPEGAFVTGDGVIRAFRVPGTPVGEVGEQQCVVSTSEGVVSAHIAEIAEIDPPRLVVVRSVTAPTGMEATYALSVPVEGSTSMSYSLTVRIANGTRKAALPKLQQHVDTELGRLRGAVMSGATLPPEGHVTAAPEATVDLPGEDGR